MSGLLLQGEELQRIQDEFQSIDTNKDGRLSRQEVADAYKHSKKLSLSSQSPQEFFDRIDVDNSGYISYDEFI